MSDCLRAISQQQIVQSAKVDAMGYRLDEMNEFGSSLEKPWKDTLRSANSQAQQRDECADYSSKRGETNA